ncbi:MAG TPA: hypothetical protein GX000_01550 [Actinomyces sp.]|nr:monovalent cation/H+ antiporter complex subunit F [Acidobacteriota bacterium]HHT40324.1 hypothetical protein [Actinomyces sp.]
MSALSILQLAAMLAMLATLFLALIRLILGPAIMDRAVASDVLSVAAVGITALLAVRTGRNDVIVLAIMFAMVGFMYSVTLGRFSERPSAPDSEVPKPTTEEVEAEEIRLVREAQSELHAEEREAVLKVRAQRKQSEEQ